MPHNLDDSCQYCEGTYCQQLQGGGNRYGQQIPLKYILSKNHIASIVEDHNLRFIILFSEGESAGSFKILVSICHTAPCHISEDCDLKVTVCFYLF